MNSALFDMITNVILPFIIILILARKKVRPKILLVTSMFGTAYALCWDILFSRSVWLFLEEDSAGFLGPLPFEEYISALFLPSTLVLLYILISPRLTEENK